MRQGLDDCLARAAKDANVKAVVILGKGQTFPSGADIKEFGKAMKSMDKLNGNVFEWSVIVLFF